MEIKQARITLQVEDATFFVRDPGVDGFYRLLKASNDKDPTVNIDMFFDHLEEIQGLTYEGKEIKTAKEFKAINPPTSFVAPLVRALLAGLGSEISSIDEESVKYAKNV